MEEQRTPIGSTSPEMPPPMASVRSSTADEVMKMMNKTPLFMTSLEDADKDGEENIELQAIRALQYDGTPLENAQNFKDQGNDMVKSKLWTDGKEFYTKAIAILEKSRQTRHHENETHVHASEAAKETDLEAICHVNRALCNLELKNYRSTTLDCAQVLRHDPKNIKAFYRSGVALLALDKVAEASDVCARGLIVETSNIALQALSKTIEARRSALISTETKRRADSEQKKKKNMALALALKSRNIRLRQTKNAPDLDDAYIHLGPDPTSSTSTLYFPLVLLYPIHAQSDFIKAISEKDTIMQQLEYIFPLPWDESQEYSTNRVEIYIETASGGLTKVGNKVTMAKLLGNDQIDLVDGLVKVSVVPREKTSEWIAQTKAKLGK